MGEIIQQTDGIMLKGENPSESIGEKNMKIWKEARRHRRINTRIRRNKQGFGKEMKLQATTT